MRNCWRRPSQVGIARHGGPTRRRHTVRGLRVAQTPELRPARRPPICHNTPAITTTRQNSHVIRLREHSTTSRNVAIPTTTIQCLKQSRGNYVRNWWALGNRSGTEVFPQRRLLTTLRTTDPSRKPPTHALSCTDDEAPATRSSPHSSHEPLQMQIRRGADLAVGPSAYPINTVQVVPVSSSKCLSSALREPVWPVPYSLVMTPTVGGQPCDNGKGS